jgi:hypothetical protein
MRVPNAGPVEFVVKLFSGWPRRTFILGIARIAESSR